MPPKEFNVGELLTIGEVAETFSVTRQTVTRWCRNNKLPHMILPNGHYRIPRSEIDRFMVLSGTQESVHHVPVLPGQTELCI